MNSDLSIPASFMSVSSDVQVPAEQMLLYTFNEQWPILSYYFFFMADSSYA